MEKSFLPTEINSSNIFKLTQTHSIMDLMDYLVSQIFKFFGWLLGGILKLALLIVTGIFKGIASLFKKNG